MKQFARILPIVIAVLLALPGSGMARKGSFDIYANGTTKGGDVPVIPGLVAQGDASVNAGGTTKGGDVPVTPGLVSRDPQVAVAGGNNGEVPVVTG